MKDHKMTSIQVKVNTNALNQICMNNQAGNRVEITKSYSANGNFEARPIPKNHTIVGLYGKIDVDYSYIPSLGFIVMESPANLWFQRIQF